MRQPFPVFYSGQRKMDKWDAINMKNVCISKDTVKKVNRQPTEGQKIFANHLSDKDLYSEYLQDS